MGVQGLWELLAPVGRRVSVETLAGKRLAIDASIWIVQFMKAMRDEKGEMVRNAHVLGFFRRICKLLFLRTKPVFVFDGGTPSLKRRTIALRRRHRENARAKIRKVAEKLLLNHLKAKKLEELATELKRSKENNDAKGKGILADEENNFTESSSGGKQKTVTDATKQEELDELFAASLAAEEENLYDIGEPSFPDAYGEDDVDDDSEEMMAPVANGNVDSAILASLPPSMQLDLLVQMRERQMAENRQKYQKIKKMPTKFSELQIQSYLKTVAFRREIDKVQKCAAGRGFGGIQTFRIASEKNREFIFSSSFTGDKNILTSDSFHKNEETNIEGTKKARKDTVGHNQFSCQFNIRSEELFEKQIQDIRNDVTDCDERDHSHVDKAVEMDVRVIQDLQGNLDRTRENGASINSEKKHSSDVESNFCGGNSLPIRNLKTSGNENPTAMQISFSENDTGRNDNYEDFFSYLVSRNSILNLLPEKNSSKKISEDSVFLGSDDICKERLHKEEVRSDSDNLHDKVMLPSIDTTPGDGGIDWEEGVCLVPATDSPFRIAAKTFSRHSAEEEDLQEAIRRSLSDLKQADPVAQHDPKMEHSNVNYFPHIFSSCSKQLQSKLGNVDVASPKKTIVDFHQDAHPLVEQVSSLSSLVAENSGKLSLLTEKTIQSISDSSRIENDNEGLENNFEVEVFDDDDETRINNHEKDLSISAHIGRNSDSGNLVGLAAVTSCKESSGNGTEVVHDDIDIHETSNILSDSQFLKQSSDLAKCSFAAGAGLFVMDYNKTHFDGELCYQDDAAKQLKVEKLAPQPSKTKKTGDQKGMHGSITLEEADHVDIEDESESSLGEEILRLRQERVLIGNEQRKLEVTADSVCNEMFAECQELLQMFGLPYIIAPMEAEAQCAHMELMNLVDGVVTDDSDVFLFGARHVYKNIFDDRKYVETYFMKDIENELGLTRDKLIRMALLLGSDYTEGVSGIGIVNAIEIVHAFSEDDGLQKFREWLESPDPDILEKIGPHARRSLKNKSSGLSESNEKGVDQSIKVPSIDSVLDKAGEQVPANDASIPKKTFMIKHRNISKNWLIPSTFPSESVFSAYTTPQVDQSKEHFSWGKPDLFLLRKLCWEKFGWSNQKADELILPVLKEYNKHETQLRLEAFYNFNERFAKIRSKRIRKAVKGITGCLSSELISEDDQNINDVQQKRTSLKQSEAGVDGCGTMSKKSQRFDSSKVLAEEEDAYCSGEIHREREENLCGRGGKRSKKRGRCQSNKKLNYDNSKTKTESDNAVNDQQIDSAEGMPILRRSCRHQKHRKYVEDNTENNIFPQTSGESRPGETSTGKEPVVNIYNAPSCSNPNGQSSNEEVMPMDYLCNGGGFCSEEGEVNEFLVQSAISSEKASSRSAKKTVDPTNTIYSLDVPTNDKQVCTNLKMASKEGSVGTKDSILLPHKLQNESKSQSILSAMPSLRRKRRS